MVKFSVMKDFSFVATSAAQFVKEPLNINGNGANALRFATRLVEKNFVKKLAW